MHELQKKLLEATNYISLKGLTLREIGNLVGLKHPQMIKHHLTQLVKNGLLDSRYRPIPVGQAANSSLLNIPILGSANCGEATRLAVENLEGYLRVSPSLIPTKRNENLFALKAIGDSMNKAKMPIEDGDYVIIDETNVQPTNIDYVVSIIDGSANIKRFYFDKDKNLIYLLSESTKNYPPIVINSDNSFSINGKVVAVIKKPRGNGK